MFVFSRTTHTANVVATQLNIPFHAPHCKVSYSLTRPGTEPGKMTMGGEKYKLFSVLK
jgi:hypothetical protein